MSLQRVQTYALKEVYITGMAAAKQASIGKPDTVRCVLRQNMYFKGALKEKNWTLQRGFVSWWLFASAAAGRDRGKREGRAGRER